MKTMARKLRMRDTVNDWKYPLRVRYEFSCLIEIDSTKKSPTSYHRAMAISDYLPKQEQTEEQYIEPIE